MGQFSRRGERVTDFERGLIECAAECSSEAQGIWRTLARRIGVDALAVLMDEVGGEKIHVPTREYFFAELFRKMRDADIVRRLAKGEPAETIAKDYGVHKNTIWNVARTADGSPL